MLAACQAATHNFSVIRLIASPLFFILFYERSAWRWQEIVCVPHKLTNCGSMIWQPLLRELKETGTYGCQIIHSCEFVHMNVLGSAAISLWPLKKKREKERNLLATDCRPALHTFMYDRSRTARSATFLVTPTHRSAYCRCRKPEKWVRKTCPQHSLFSFPSSAG